VKPETAPEIGQVVQTTTTKRILAASPIATEPRTPELWEYLAEVDRTADWERHIIYVHRVDPTPSVPVQKCQQYFWCPDNQRVPICDQQEMEFALQRYFGGKKFRLMVKRGAQLITKGEIYVDAPPRSFPSPPDVTPLPNPVAPMGSTLGSSTNSDMANVANKAIDTIAGQEHHSLAIAVNALGATANMVERLAKGGGQGGDPLQQQFMAAMIARMAEDPLEKIVKLFAVMRELNAMAGGGPAAAAAIPGLPPEFAQQLLKAMFDKFMNPTPAGAPVSASAELMRQLPQLGNTVAESLAAFARAREAEASIVAMQRGQPARPVAPGAPAAPNPQVIPPAMPSLVQPPAGNGAPTMEFVERKIVEMLQQPVSAEQAADDVLAFLSPLDEGKAVEQLAMLGRDGLIKLFTTRPNLRPATANMGRLVEFIDAFLKMYAEDLAAAHAAAPPATAAPGGKPPLPN